MKRILLCLLMVLSACSLSSLTKPRDLGNAHRVYLTPLSQSASCGKPVKGTLIVGYPDAPDTLDTSRIALIDKDGRWDYFAGMRWADFLPGSVQTALIGSFTATGNFTAVDSDDTLAHGRLSLSSEIRKFEAVYHAGTPAPEAEIEMFFTLRESRNLAVKKQFTVSASRQAAADTADGVTEAFIQAFLQAQQDAVRKTLGCEE